MKPYRYIYFRTYMWNYLLWKNKEMSAFNSILAVTFSLSAFIFSIQLLLEKQLDRFLPSPFDNLYVSIALGFLILIWHYFLFEHNKKYLDIESEFIEGKKNKRQWKIRGFFTFLYTIGSIIVYIIID